MRKHAVWLAAAWSVGLLSFCSPGHAQQEPPNIIVNGGFEDGAMTPWNVWGGNSTGEVVTTCAGAAVAEKPVEGKYCLHVKVPGATTNWWDASVNQGVPAFQKGKKYTLSLWLKSKSGTAQMNLKPEHGADPWTGYAETQVTMTDTWAEYTITTPVFTQDVSPASITLHIGFAAQEFWMDAVRWYEGDYVPPAFLKQFAADSPTPAVDAVDVPRDAVLSWEPGPFAATHNVFFGTNFDDVNNASAATATVEASLGQTGTTFDPAGLLEYGKVYYWRVDEVNAPPDTMVYKGNTWSFTAEPYAYLVTNIKATASSSDKPANGPQNTVNNSGLVDGGHSVASADMWVTKAGAASDPWIQYEFDRPYKLQEMRVWNYNTESEILLGFGFKDVVIDYSLNGADWTLLMETQFEQATSESGYAPTAAISLNGVYAKFIRLSAKSNWSQFGLKQYGLSEVQFLQVPVVARAPQPAVNADGVELNATLSWRPGRESAAQKVYFSADRQAVVDGTAPSAEAGGNSYQPGSLDYAQVYYWKVNGLTEAGSTWEGEIWSFSSTESFAVDDFESYNDAEGQNTRIYETWLDGYSDASSGSIVGNFEPPFAEQTIVHGGSQSMPMDYNNIVSPYFSEAVRVFPSNQDWTVKGVTDLILWVRGQSAPIAPVTETTAGKLTVAGEGSDIWNASDQFTFVYKTLSGDGVITARVTSNGTGSNSWAKGGVMIRDSLDGGSAHAMMVLTGGSAGGNGAAFQNRASTDLDMGANDATSNTNSPTVIAPPYYVKIERKGNGISGSVSPDGTTWTPMGTTQYIPMTAPSYIGFCVTSGAPGEYRTYTFESIKATGATGEWQTKEVGLVRNSPQDLYVTVEDAGTKKATATNPSLVTAGQWTEWRIPLNSFSGVNMSKVKKLYLGVGSKDNPQPDGAGRIYVDDIRVGRRGSVDPGSAGLQASYTLEGNALDGSGNGHDGTVMGSPVYVAGQAGQALQFDGKAAERQYVDCGTWNPSAATGQLTVSVWAKWAGLSGFYQGVVAKRDTWAANDMMWQIEANIDTGILSFSRTDSNPASGNPVLPVGEWTHVAVTFDGTTAKFFVNAVQTGQGAFSLGLDPAAGVHFGCCDSNGNNPFNGVLDEVKLYDRALSSFEINYLAGR